MIIIGVPTTGAIPTRVAGSINSVLLYRKDVFPFYVEGSLVYDARAKILNYARQNHADLLFLDSDIEFSLDAYDRLIWRDTDIVSGLYFGRREGQNNPVAYKTVKPHTLFRKKAVVEPVTEFRPYMEVEGVGLGFCLIKNHVLMSFSEKINPFEPFGDLGEDFSFCVRCRKNGYKIMLDSTFQLNHLGEYSYNAKDYQGGQDGKTI